MEYVGVKRGDLDYNSKPQPPLFALNEFWDTETQKNNSEAESSSKVCSYIKRWTLHSSIEKVNQNIEFKAIDTP